MTYIKQVWVNDNPSTPLNATRLNYIEDGIEAVARKGEQVFDPQEHSSWDPIAGDNDDALAAKLTDASLAGQGNVLVPESLKISINHLVPGGVNLVGSGTILCTTANSRISYGDLTTARYGGLSSGFTVDGNDVATNPFYIGIDVGRTFINIDVTDSTDTNLVLHGSQNNCFINFNTSGGPDQIHIERGAATNIFIRCEFNDSSNYHALFRTNGAVIPVLGTNVPGFNHFLRCIFERGPGGPGTVIFRHEAGLNNTIDSCVLADGSEAGGVDAIPILVQILKAGAEASTGLTFAGDTTLQSNEVSASSVGLDLGDNCKVVNTGSLHFVGQAIGIQHNISGYLEDVGWLDLASVTTATSGPAFYANALIQQRRPFGTVYTRPASETAIGVLQPGDVAARLMIYGDGTIHMGGGAVAPVKVVGARGAAVADATDAASAITQLNALLARLRAATGHGLIA